MGCCQYFTPTEGGADAFTVEMPRLTFGRGCLAEVGERVKGRGVKRAAVITDLRLEKKSGGQRGDFDRGSSG